MQGKFAEIRRFLFWTALYVAAAVVASRFLRGTDGMPLFWPAAGIGYAVVVRYGLRWSAVVGAGTVLYLLGRQAGYDVIAYDFIAYAAIGTTAATALGAWYVTQGRTMHLRIEDGMRLLGGGVLVSLLDATSGMAAMELSGAPAQGSTAATVARSALGDLLGMAVVAPSVFLITAARARGHRLSTFHDGSSLRERLFWLALLVTGSLAIYSKAGHGQLYVLGLTSLSLVLLLWSALRFSPVWTAVSTGTTVAYFAVATGLGLGGFAAPASLAENAVLMVLLSLMAVVPVMMSLAGLEQRTTSWALYQRATRDTLTGLLNRTAFEEEARRRLARPDVPATLLYIDVDNLKLINDSTSHVAGDDMIHAIAGAIGAAVGDDAVLARTGGDEFAILVPKEEAAALVLARRLLNEIEATRITAGDQVLSTTATIGLVSTAAGERDYDALYSHADAACFSAKELGGNRVHVSHPSSDEVQAHNAVMRSALRVREVIEAEQFLLYCQPIVPMLADPSGVHFEVLLRWREPDGRIQVPAQLISAAERFRMGPRIDRYVIDAMLRWLERNPDAARDVRSCGINLGGATLTDEHFADWLAARLRRSSFPAQHLCLEITETSVVRDRKRAQRFIGQMRDLGCRFALDDFGTGFCSFGYLNDLDVDSIKIDGSFIRGLDQSPVSQAVVRSLADIAHVMGKVTVAEQVETEAERARLEQMNVDYAQGYLFGRPQAIETFFGAVVEVV